MCTQSNRGGKTTNIALNVETAIRSRFKTHTHIYKNIYTHA